MRFVQQLTSNRVIHGINWLFDGDAKNPNMSIVFFIEPYRAPIENKVLLKELSSRLRVDVVVFIFVFLSVPRSLALDSESTPQNRPYLPPSGKS